MFFFDDEPARALRLGAGFAGDVCPGVTQDPHGFEVPRAGGSLNGSLWQFRQACVDINPAVVTKLADRGSFQAIGIVTDVGLFLEQLARILGGG